MITGPVCMAENVIMGIRATAYQLELEGKRRDCQGWTTKNMNRSKKMNIIVLQKECLIVLLIESSASEKESEAIVWFPY